MKSTLRQRKGRGKVYWAFEDFGMYFTPQLVALMEDPDLTKLELRLFLLAGIEARKSDNVVPLRQHEMAARLGTSRQAVNRALAELKKRGVIVQEGQTYMLNPHFATRMKQADTLAKQHEVRKVLVGGR